MSLIAELRQRKLVQWALAYAAGAWAALQVLSLLIGAYQWPDSTLRVGIVVAIVGFFMALVLAWYHGERGEQRLARVEIFLLAGLIALGAVMAWRTAHVPVPKHADVDAVVAAAISDKSIAVLPFENLSDDKANAFFADGIQDEILTRLAKIGTLKVISRTSTLRYASQPDNLRAIASQLGVANILEGSVQKAGDTVRINVQLIRADGDSHLWAETYDRKLDNVFGVESEVAKAIADALDATLTGADKAELARRPTTNADAWQANLRGLALYDRPDIDQKDIIEAAKSFDQAVQLDPAFASAWAALAVADASLVFTEGDASAARRDAAKQALAQAVRLSPDSFETRRAQAYVIYFLEREYDGARTIFEQIRSMAPSDAEIPRALALIARREGHWDESDRLFAQALDLDPRNTKVLMWAADNRVAERQFPQALRLLDRMDDILPNDAGANSRRAGVYLAMGDFVRVQDVLARIRSDDAILIEFNLLRFQHRYADGVTRMRKAVADSDPADPGAQSGAYYCLADFQRLAGDEAGAKVSYARSLADLNTALAAAPDSLTGISARAVIYANLGRRDEALRDARAAMAALPAAKDALVGPYFEEALVRVQARLGNRDAAIAGLQHLLAIPYQGIYNVALTPTTVALDPDFNALHDDPRFQALVKDAKKL